MLPQQTDASVSTTSAQWAQRATIRAVLNSYLRETSETDPRTDPNQDPHMFPNWTGYPFLLTLSSVGKTIAGELKYYSIIGQHVYGPAFYELAPDGAQRKLEWSALVGLLLEEVSARATPGQGEVYVRQMRTQIENSCRKMGLHLDHGRSRQPASAEWKLDCVRSEQSLYYGHPFHPYPKSTEGFTDEELAKYSPEMGAAFRLHYFAVHQALVSEEWVDGHGPLLAPDVKAAARGQLGERASEYAIVPMHPWQADYVLQRSEVRARMDRAEIISLGQLGPLVYPTSSVRTVWDPSGGYGYKLPLHVRITNLVRENTREQARRTMDAAKLIQHLQGELQSDSFKVLMETGCTSVRIDPSQEDTPYFTVIYRPMAVDNASTFVLASLLESLPGGEEPKLMGAIRQSNSGRLPDLCLWLERYLRISMLPFLRLLAKRGISFEAHLQNSLISIKEGLPDCYYVRDLEGVSVDRRMAADAGWIGTLLPGESPVLYAESEAWKRTLYYFFVNHLGSLIHTLAAFERMGEGHYWRVARTLLQQEKEDADARLRAYIDDLLHRETLPAKANLFSCFLQRGETPMFVDIPNPLKA